MQPWGECTVLQLFQLFLFGAPLLLPSSTTQQCGVHAVSSVAGDVRGNGIATKNVCLSVIALTQGHATDAPINECTHAQMEMQTVSASPADIYFLPLSASARRLIASGHHFAGWKSCADQQNNQQQQKQSMSPAASARVILICVHSIETIWFSRAVRDF